jgi:hypothetical protein
MTLVDLDRESFGGFINPNSGLATLPAWYQCGDTTGKYPDIICGNEGFDCVYINEFYWQCRNDNGGASVQGRRLASAPRRLLRQ